MFGKIAYLYLLRVPIVIGALLVAFPILAVFPLKELLGNLFVLDGLETFETTALALIACWSILLTGRLVLLNGKERFDAPSTGLSAATLSWKSFCWVILLATPSILAQFLDLSSNLPFGTSGKSGFVPAAFIRVVAIGAGAVVAYLLSFLGLWVAVLLAPANTQVETANTFPCLSRLRKLLSDANKQDPLRRVWARLGPSICKLKPGWRDGFVDAKGLPLSGIWLATAFAAVTVAFYVWIDILKRSALGDPRGMFPAFFFVLWLFLNANWAFSLAAFFLDRWRIPLILPLTLLFSLAAFVPSNDHYFAVRSGATVRSIPPACVLKQRLSRQRKIILVAAAGGGIQAAAWTAQVLTGLQADSPGSSTPVQATCPPGTGCAEVPPSTDPAPADFADDLTAVSSVSGGAVGAMFFLNAYNPARGGFAVEPPELPGIVQMAASGTLEDTAWSLVYHDIPRLYSLFSTNQKLDRGYLLEQSWKRRGPVNAWLSNWQEGVLEGKRPVAIFNSTIVETGEPMLFTTSEIKDPKTPAHRWNFFDKYPDSDVAIVTAVRMAATFPYVSPAARPDTPGPEFHLVDGGYFDNYGVSSLLQWLHDGINNDASPPEVLIAQITAFPNEPEQQATSNKSAMFQLYAPFDALMGVRGSSQLIRDRTELERFRDQYEGKVTLCNFQFTGKDAPLSWQMNRTQVKAITQMWDKYRQPSHEPSYCEFLKVRCFINGNASGCKDGSPDPANHVCP